MQSLLKQAITEAAITGEVSQNTADSFADAVAEDPGAGEALVAQLQSIEAEADAAITEDDAMRVLAKLKTLAGM